MCASLLQQYRCNCGKLLFKAANLSGRIEIKCKRCGIITAIDNAHFEDIRDHYDGVAQITVDGVYTRVSATMSSLLGYVEHDMLNKSMFDFFCKNIAETKKKEFERLVISQHSFRILHNQLSCRDGRVIAMDMHYVPYHTDRQYFILGYTLMSE